MDGLGVVLVIRFLRKIGQILGAAKQERKHYFLGGWRSPDGLGQTRWGVTIMPTSAGDGNGERFKPNENLTRCEGFRNMRINGKLHEVSSIRLNRSFEAKTRFRFDSSGSN
jgi:hypothetical protein